MKFATMILRLGACCSLLVSAAASAVIDNNIGLDTTLAGTPPASTSAPAVNVLLRDFSDAAPGAYGSFEWIRNTIEVQVTTGSGLYDDLGGTCCAVQGAGNLSGQERLTQLYLNVNPSLDLDNLQVYWVGAPMDPGPPGSNTFPAAGKQPVSFLGGTDLFTPQGAGSFDLLINWGSAGIGPSGIPYSKLLFVYDNGATDISAADFLVGNASANVAAGLITRGLGTERSVIAAIPEPESYALLGIGLLGVGIALRRQRRVVMK